MWDPKFLSGLGKIWNMHIGIIWYRKGPGASNLSGLDENPDYTCPDKAELPVLVHKGGTNTKYIK